MDGENDETFNSSTPISLVGILEYGKRKATTDNTNRKN